MLFMVIFSPLFLPFFHPFSSIFHQFIVLIFLSDPGVPGVRYMGPVVTHSLTEAFEDLIDESLADGDTKSILTDTANRVIQGNVAMHVTHPVNLVVKFRTNASSVIWWQNLRPMHYA